MTEPEEPRWSGSDPNHEQSKSDEFRETLAAPMPNRSYRQEVDLTDSQPSTVDQLVRYIAAVLILLLAVRFIINLFTLDRSGAWVGFFYLTTDWLVQPFQGIFGQSSVSGASGFTDWAALAAIIAIGVITGIISIIVRPRSS